MCAFMENLGAVPYRFTYKGKSIVFHSLQEVQTFIKGIRSFEELVEVKSSLLGDYNFEAWIKGVKADGGV